MQDQISWVETAGRENAGTDVGWKKQEHLGM